MLGLNVTHFDDRRLCSPQCTESSIAVFDFPNCAGSCSPQDGLLELNLMADCKGPAVPAGHEDVPMENEIIALFGVVSGKPNPPE